MNIICIVARTNSTRLPKKVLKQIGNQRMIEHLIERMKLSKNFDAIYLCTSKHPDDKILIEIAENKGIDYIAGSELAVIERLLVAAKNANADNLVRVTGDNPLTDPFILDNVLMDHLEKDFDYSIMNFLPRGATGDVIKVSALKKLYNMMDPNESQYLAIYINNPKEFRCNFIYPPKNLFSPYITFSVDTPKEFKDVSYLIEKLGNSKSTETYLALSKKKNLCEFSKDSLVKISESKTMRYEDYIKWQINKYKNELL